MKATLVDLCGTLVRENTTRAFLRSLNLRGWRRWLRAASLSRPAARLGANLPGDPVRSAMLLCLRGLDRDVLRAAADAYVAGALAERADADVLAAVRGAVAEEAVVVLATASLDPIAAAVVRRLKMTGAVSSRLAYAGAACRGQLEDDATGRKWEAVIERFPAVSSAEEVVVYTDNPEDVDLMHHATEFHWKGDPRRRPYVAQEEAR